MSIFIAITYFVVYIVTAFLVYDSASESLNVYFQVKGMERVPNAVSGEFINEQNLAGGVRVKLFITTWKKENPEQKYKNNIIMERNWFFGKWKILLIEEKEKPVRDKEKVL